MYYKVESEDRTTSVLLPLDEGKAQMGITHDEKDTEVQLAIDTAINKAAKYMGRTLYPAVITACLTNWSREIIIGRGPVVAVASIKYYKYDETELTTLSTELYKVIDKEMESIIIIDDSFSFDSLDDRPDALQIAFSAGYVDKVKLPIEIKYGIILYMKSLYIRGDAPDNKITTGDNLLRSYRIER